MTITQVPQPATVRPKRRIGSFETMLVIEEQGTDDLEITQHPVQEGAQISDHAYLKPATVRVKALFDAETASLEEVYKALLDFQAEREPFDVVTGKRIYRNMLIKSLGQTTDVETENVLSVNFDMQEVIIVSVEVATVPARSKQKSPARTSGTQNAGAKSAKDESANPKKRTSIIKSGKNAGSAIFGG